MAKYNFKAKNETDNNQPEKKVNDMCEAFGCPRKAQVNTGHWNCRYHSGRNVNVLANITMLLKNHEREIDWYEKVLNMAYHEFDILKGNAPPPMMHLAGEDLIKYRVRMAGYINGLLKHPDRVRAPAKTYIEFTSEIE
jgi:hypothetical protein